MSTNAELDGLRRLMTPEGATLLAELPAVHTTADVLALTTRLRSAGYDAPLVAAALTLQRLRAKAETKFGPLAANLWTTTDGLEQATALPLAARHAERFRAAGCSRVADLGCGIGTESIALAGLGLQVLAVDADEAHAALALMNLTALPGAEVRHTRIEDLDLAAEGVDGAFADPARRGPQGRRFDPEAWSPPLSSILSLRQSVPRLGVKVAPGIDYAALPPEAHVQWASIDGSVREAAIWLGDLAPEGPGRSALILDSGGTARCYPAPAATADAAATTVECVPLGTYVHTLDGAIIRAGALATLAAELEAGLLSEGIAYLTGDRASDLPGVTSFRVLEVLPAGAKPLGAALRERGVGSVEILKRGLDTDVAAFRHKLKLRGDRNATIILTRVAGRHVALLVQREESVAPRDREAR